MLDQDLVKRLENIESLLQYPAGMDHYCEEADCDIDNPKCTEMHVKAALYHLREVLDPPMIGISPDRTSWSDAERIIVEEWEKENERSPGRNYGARLIEILLCPQPKSGAIDDYRAKRISKRDAEVATTIIQWLGTNVGSCFLNTCEKRIAAARAKRKEWSAYVNYNRKLPSEFEETVKALAMPWPPGMVRNEAERAIGAALANARKEGYDAAMKKVLDAAKD